MEYFSFNIAQKLLERLASHAFREFRLALGVKHELNKLQETLSTIAKVLVDAEEKQMKNSKDDLLTEWLGKLKDVCNDIDDVLDEFEFRTLRMQVLNPRGSSSNVKGKVRNWFSVSSNSVVFRLQMSHRIKDIRERLGEIAAAKSQFNLSERAGGWHGVHAKMETHSFVHESDVIGRDWDKNMIVKSLLKGNADNDENVSVVSVYGFGGLGKTTLAKLVYNDINIVQNFELRMWVCVSDDFNVKRLMREIVHVAANEDKYAEGSTERMQIRLRNALNNKKFFLVLDDVWDKEPNGVTLSKWNDLKSLLRAGTNGSKIIVTTRDKSVALLMGSAHAYELKGLLPLDSMSIFMKMAFKKREEEHFPNLIKIGKDIVNKCRGVPLALSTLGCLLNPKREESYWLYVRDNDIWKFEQGDDGILPALRLSYNALPPYLKPCFALCSLFPKGYKFLSTQLVQLWMAQGFLQSSEGNQELEEIGLDYINQLCSRSFFRIHEDINVAMQITMHDLVHDLAISVSQIDCSSLNFRPHYHAFERARVRHVSISRKDLKTRAEGEQEADPKFLLHLDKLRTILFPYTSCQYLSKREVGLDNESLLETCISRFKYLRALDLCHSTLEVIPSSIGRLSHLRYLDLSFNQHIELLPESICELYHLQTLLLLRCFKLKELPKNIGNLISLRYLELTTRQTHFPEEGIGRLTSLQTLYLAECKNLISLGKVMQSLTKLRRLFVVDCQNLVSLSCTMKDCTKMLETLVIHKCPVLDLERSVEGIRGLRVFWITNLTLETLPNWLQESANTLQTLCLMNCGNLSELPEWFQKLTALRELQILGCAAELNKRCSVGKDWFKIANVPKVTIL